MSKLKVEFKDFKDYQDKKNNLLLKAAATLIKEHADLAETVNKLSKKIDAMEQENALLISRIGKRDEAFLDFLKAKVEVVKTVETDKNGEDYIKKSFKIVKK